jgi:hypothetical protein
MRTRIAKVHTRPIHRNGVRIMDTVSAHPAPKRPGILTPAAEIAVLLYSLPDCHLRLQRTNDERPSPSSSGPIGAQYFLFITESLVPSQDVQSKIITLSGEGIFQFGQHYAV